MPSPKSGGGGGASCQRYREKNRKGRLAEKAMSFHGREAAEMILPRPRTVPELIRRGGRSTDEEAVVTALTPNKNKQLTKILVKVTVQRSIGPLHVVMPMESTVEDLITAVVRQYVKECRRPMLESNEHSKFDLHYSQFCLESLDRKDKLMDLGSRNFFLCPKKADTGGTTFEVGGPMVASTSSCKREAERETKKGLTWLKFLDFSR